MVGPGPHQLPMTDPKIRERSDLDEVRRGLRMARPPDPAELAAEIARLEALDAAPPLRRWAAFTRLSGPGYLQSAMTLGSGTAASALFAGAAFGYELLWVAPTAMLLGVIMLSAVGHQTLSTGIRPFDAMRRFAGAPLAWAWAIGALLASVIWHFPQYAMAAGVLGDLGELAGIGTVPPAVLAGVILAWAIALSSLYGSSPRLVRTYERLIKLMVWGIVLCFGAVVWRTGIHDWGALARGLIRFRIPGERHGIAGLTLVISGLAAAVGVNMVFLYPYSLLARGWGRAHRRLARFDLIAGMLLPYTLAASLMLIAAANTIHASGDFAGTRLSPVEAAQILGGELGPTTGRLIFGLGVLGMALSSITLHMLVAGFVASEVFGWTVGSRRYRLATLIPIPGALGPIFWSKIAVWVAVPTNVICGFLLPAAYIGFLRLQRSRAYLGADRPKGVFGNAWFGGMLLSTLILMVFLGWYLLTEGPGWLDRIG